MYSHNVHVHTGEYGDGGGLASSIMAQEGSDLTLIHVQTQFIHCHLPPLLSFSLVTTPLYIHVHVHVLCMHVAT